MENSTVNNVESLVYLHNEGWAINNICTVEIIFYIETTKTQSVQHTSMDLRGQRI